MLLVPLFTGAAAGNPHGERIIWVLLFAAAALGLFCLRTPVEAGLEISAVTSAKRCGAEADSLFHLYLCFRCRLGPDGPDAVGSRIWTPPVGCGRSDCFSSPGHSEKTWPENAHERPTDGRHRAELHFGGSLLFGDGSFRPDGRNRSGWRIGCSQPTRFISFNCESIPREPSRPGRNSAREEVFCCTKRFACCCWA